jgi:hypothetical protein
MPAANEPKRVVARRTVWRILRQYVDTMLARFSPPEELIKKVEEKLPATPESGTNEPRPPSQ